MASIVTKFLGPTNHRGARVVAQVSDYGSPIERAARAEGKPGRLVVDWDYRAGVEGNHANAAKALAKALDWDGAWTGGEAPGGAGYVFVRPGHVDFYVEPAQ